MFLVSFRLNLNLNLKALNIVTYFFLILEVTLNNTKCLVLALMNLKTCNLFFIFDVNKINVTHESESLEKFAM